MEHQKLKPGDAPRLFRRAEFEAALEHYKISKEGQKVLNATPFVAMVGPTSAGRNTVIRELLKTGHYHFIISDTTRPPRQNDGVWEQEGVEYFFRNEDNMLADIQAGLFVEAELIHSQQVSGVSIREIKRAKDEGKVAITDVEILGGLNIAKLKKDTIVIYLAPPSFEVWLQRIHGRTPVSKAELRNRLEGALKGFELGLGHPDFIFVINTEMIDTAKVIEAIVREDKRSLADEKAARELVQKIAEETRAYLGTLDS